MRNILKVCIIGLIIILIAKFILVPYLDKKIELDHSSINIKEIV